MSHAQHILVLDQRDLQYDDWWCIQIKPQRCSCGEIITFASDDFHLIIIWPDRVDIKMNELYRIMEEAEFEPYIMQYHAMYGDCIEFEDAVRLGTLVDGFIRY